MNKLFNLKDSTIVDETTIIDPSGIMWKRIPLFDLKYWASEYGSILNMNTLHILKETVDWAGYRAVYLSFYGKDNTYKVHRLVALAFLPNPNNYPVVLHLDNNKLNCHYTNLKWGTYSENRQQAIDDGLARNPDVRQYFKVYNEETGDYKLCYGIRELMELTEYPHSTGGLYRIARENSKLRTGPYTGYKIEKMDLTPAWTYQGVIGFNISKYKE